MNNFLTVDVEDWYQAIETIPYSQWNKFESRIEKSVGRLLKVLDAHEVKATFFILGFEAERHPAMVRSISECGHEIATHGYSHRFIYHMDKDEFKEDLRLSIDILESITNEKVLGHRAPAWSITQYSLWALDVICEEGLVYDSSIFPCKSYLFGIKGSPCFPYKIKDVFAMPKNTLYEFPVATARVMGKDIPFVGGFFTRLWPLWVIKHFMRELNRMGQAAMVWVHPWDLDVAQPRLKLPWHLRRHYYNLGSTEIKLCYLLKDFKFSPIRDFFYV